MVFIGRNFVKNSFRHLSNNFFFHAAVFVYRSGRHLTFYVDADITFINSKNLTGIGKIKFGQGKGH